MSANKPVTVSDIIAERHGSTNWVLARRTRRIVERYGADVVTLTQKQYAAAAKEADIRNAEFHPAYLWFKKLFGNHCDAVNIIRGLREEGFKIEKVHE